MDLPYDLPLLIRKLIEEGKPCIIRYQVMADWVLQSLTVILLNYTYIGDNIYTSLAFDLLLLNRKLTEEGRVSTRHQILAKIVLQILPITPMN